MRTDTFSAGLHSAAAVHVACMTLRDRISDPTITLEAASAVVDSLVKVCAAHASDYSISLAVCEGLLASTCRGPLATAALAATPGVVPAVLSVLRLHGGSNPSVESVACRTLAALSVCHEGATATANGDGIDMLQVALHRELAAAASLASDGGKDSVLPAMDALVALSAHVSLHTAMVESRAIDAVISALKFSTCFEGHDAALAVGQAAIVVANVTLDDTALAHFIDAGGIPLLVSALDRFCKAVDTSETDIEAVIAHVCAAM
jgi:hypothetical protein